MEYDLYTEKQGQDANFVIFGGTTGCQNDDLWYHQ